MTCTTRYAHARTHARIIPNFSRLRNVKGHGVKMRFSSKKKKKIKRRKIDHRDSIENKHEFKITWKKQKTKAEDKSRRNFIIIYFYLILFSLIFHTLKNRPRVSSTNFHSCQITSIPLLNQNGGLYS